MSAPRASSAGFRLDRKNAQRFTGSVMTADVAQAVANLRAKLLAVDALDDKIAAATTETARSQAAMDRTKARRALETARSDLELILLGDE